MDSNANIFLSLSEQESISDLKVHVYEEELKEINSKFPLNVNQIDIQQTFFIKDNSTIEVGFFIRNGTRNKISIEGLPLVLEDEDGICVATEVLNLKEHDAIPAASARPYSVKFSICKDSSYNEEKFYKIKFANVNNITAISAVNAEIENMPLDIDFEEEEAIKDIVGRLETLKPDEFTISFIKLVYTKDEGFACISLLRNGSNKTAIIEKLPIRIVSEEGKTIAEKLFYSQGGLVAVNPKKSKIVKFKFHPFEISNSKFDISKCQIIYN